MVWCNMVARVLAWCNMVLSVDMGGGDVTIGSCTMADVTMGDVHVNNELRPYKSIAWPYQVGYCQG